MDESKLYKEEPYISKNGNLITNYFISKTEEEITKAFNKKLAKIINFEENKFQLINNLNK